MDRYQRIRKIGEGAFGKAVLVRHKQTNKQCVVKEINIVRMPPKEREDSRKEVAVLAQLKHPNIVTYIESFEEAGTLYIVMNYCAGGDLYGKINGQRGVLFPEDQVLMWFAQICLAIKHIHDRKILHRDIKSQNIFLSTSGTIQLGDFGIAKVLNNTVELARTCIGTPYYLSPEIVENKPYNNKSDIWSLGCVLYELTTLKHAFEAGNMKNLVLKIIRGSYPPIPPQYSYDLRGLIAQLFKRAPRDRPSINNVLRKNFIMERVRRVLSAEQIADEFNHTILHGAKIAKALPPAPRPSSAPKKSVTPRPGSAGQRKYNPAAVYGAPVGRRSQNRSSSEQKKKPPAPGNRPVPIPGQQEWEQKKKDLVFKEQVRREDIKKKQEDQVARRHKDLVEKQKMDRMNKAKEEGWRNLVDSLDSDKDEPKAASPRGDARPLPIPRQRPEPAQPNYLENRAGREPGNYDAYLAYLDKLKEQRQGRERELDQRIGNYMPAPRPVPLLNKPGAANGNRPVVNPGVQQANYDRQVGGQAVERAKIVDDYVQRRREAALNKARGQADLYGNRPPSAGARASPVPKPRQAPVAAGRNREEQEYLEKLRQIREQNMKERRALNQQNRGAGDNVAQEKPAHMKEAEERKKKVEALKQQADDWAKKKKEQLEKDRQDMFNRNGRGNQARPPSADGSRPNSAANRKPAVAMPITGVLHVIGAGEKAAPGGGEVTPSEEAQQGSVQQKKSEILKRLNEKPPARGKWDADKGDVTPAAEKAEARSKWGEGAVSPLAVTQPESPEPDTARSQWDKEEKLRLSDLPLEQTASQMEATSARDYVVRNPDNVGENPRSARNQWGRPGSTVVKALDKLPVYEGTVTLDSGSSQESTSATPQPAIGSTVTLSKPPIPSPTPAAKPPIRSGTITLDKPDSAAPVTTSAAAATSTAPSASATTSARPLSAEQLGVVGGTDSVAVVSATTPSAQNATQPLIGDTELPGSNRFVESHETPTERKDDELFSSNKLELVPETTEDFSEITQTAAEDSSEKNNEHLPQNDGELPEETKEREKSADTNNIQAEQQTVPEKPPQGQTVPEKPPQQQTVPEKPPRGQKPPVPKKPELLPKPVLLAKPDKPFGFSEQAPELVASESKDGKAFDKCEDPAQTQTDKKEQEQEEKDRSHSVQKGLCTGNFDMKNIQMLRTCSEPDLTRLFRTAVRGVQATLQRHQSLDLSQEVDVQKSEGTEDEAGQELDELSPRTDSDDAFEAEDKKQTAEDGKQESGADGRDDNNDDEDEDLMNMRATMQSLLLDEDEDDGSDDGALSPKIKFSLSSDAESSLKKTDDNGEGIDEKEEEIKGGSPDQKEEEAEAATAAKQVVKSKSEPVLERKHDSDEDDDENDDESEKLDYDEAELLCLNDSDEETIFGDDDEGEDLDLFGRLEQQREDLEKELGFDKFIEVYKTVQALQEDEDENMEEGARIAIQLLGHEKQHLYPRIFQLVMADTAFTEDNV